MYKRFLVCIFFISNFSLLPMQESEKYTDEQKNIAKELISYGDIYWYGLLPNIKPSKDQLLIISSAGSIVGTMQESLRKILKDTYNITVDPFREAEKESILFILNILSDKVVKKINQENSLKNSLMRGAQGLFPNDAFSWFIRVICVNLLEGIDINLENVNKIETLLVDNKTLLLKRAVFCSFFERFISKYIVKTTEIVGDETEQLYLFSLSSITKKIQEDLADEKNKKTLDSYIQYVNNALSFFAKQDDIGQNNLKQLRKIFEDVGWVEKSRKVEIVLVVENPVSSVEQQKIKEQSGQDQQQDFNLEQLKGEHQRNIERLEKNRRQRAMSRIKQILLPVGVAGIAAVTAFYFWYKKYRK